MFIRLLKKYLGQEAGAQIDVDEAVAKVLISQGVAEVVAQDPVAALLAKSMEAIVANLNATMTQTVDAALKSFADAQTKSHKNQKRIIFGEGGDGEPKRTFGQFLLAVRQRDHKTLEEMGSSFVKWEESADKKAALSTQTGTTGGYLVPTEFYTQLMQLVTEMSIVRKRATIIPMRARTVEVPTLDVTTAPSSGDTAFLGGLVARWTEEATTLNQTEPTFKQLELTNYELSGYSKISNTLIADDAIGLESFLRQLFARAISWYEDHAFLRGDGVKKPLGPVLWNGLISVTRSAASAFAIADAAGVLGRMLPGWSRKNTVWAIHPTVIVKLFQMTESGTGSDLMVIERGSDSPTMSLFGIPVEVTEKLPALNTAGDILLGDWKHYLIGDRQQIEIAFSEHAGFTTNQTFWRFVSRVGGQPWLRDKVTLSDASNTLSPFVTLAAG